MRSDRRRRRAIAPLLGPAEQLLAAPRTAAWSTGASRPSDLPNGAALLARRQGVTGRLIERAGLSSDELCIHDELVAVTDRRVLFLSAASWRRSRLQIGADYPLADVALSWCDGVHRSHLWRAYCFHLPGGRWWALETRREARAGPEEAELLVRAFAERATEIAIV